MTALNQTHLVNGAEWYFNSSSIGFAGAGDQIFQDSADGWDLFGPGAAGGLQNDRLSWHTGSLDGIFGGWRSGENIWLNASQDWDRVVLTLNPVPEPSTILLLGAGLAAAGLYTRKRRKA